MKRRKSISLSDRVLVNMQRAYEHGHDEAAHEALLFCAEHERTAPAWALEAWAAGEHPKKLRRPREHPWVTMLRVFAVVKCTSRKQYGRGNGDESERAARFLATMNPDVFFDLPVLGSARAIKRSYLRCLKNRNIGYIPLRFWRVFAERAVKVELRRQERIKSA